MSETVASGPPGRDGRGAGSARIAVVLAFIVTVLVAMALVPVLMNRRTQAIQDEMARTLVPAARLASEIQFAQARARSALQAYLLTGDGDFRVRYREALEREDAVFDSLSVVSERMALPVRERMARLDDLSFQWHFGHRAVLDERVSREEFITTLALENRAYDQLLDATSALLDAISEEQEAGRRRMARASGMEVRITWGLVLLALVAAGALWLLGIRLAQARGEAEVRRRDAVLARRFADAVLAATGDGIFGLDLEGRCTFANERAAALLGYSTSELVGRRVHDLVHAEDDGGEPIPWEACPAHRVLEGESAISGVPETLRRKDGSTFPVLFSARPMVDGFEVKGVVVTFSDMTEARAQEEALQRAVQARDEVMAVVSHDLRNPVGAIFSAASLLLDVPVSEQRREEHLERIKASARQANTLIDDLLDVARIEAGGFRVERREVDLGEVVRDAAALHRGRAEDASLDLQVHVEDGLDPVSGDRDRLIQVLSNLVDNAMKFTGPGGRVRLEARPAGEDVELVVEDSGQGMDAEALEHVFDRFWQADHGAGGGAGLGLAIVKGIVDAHGGSIDVDSEPDGGTTWRVRLPGR